MYTVTITLHGELIFFLSHKDRKATSICKYEGKRSIKDLIESLGIPHVEVDVILVNGITTDFNYIVNDNDAFDIFSSDIPSLQEPLIHLMFPPHENTRFVLDVHLQKLSRSLRLLGFDVFFNNRVLDREISEIAAGENRIVLTRDRRLLMRKNIKRGFIVRNTDPKKQITEIVERLKIRDLCNPFTRCIECNGLIEYLDLSDTTNNNSAQRIPPGVRLWCSEYYQCKGCHRIYWKGSHYERLWEKMNKILNSSNEYE